MKPLLRRLAATAAVAAALSSQVAGNAAADSELSTLQPSQCRPFEPTADGNVPQAWHLDRLHMEEAWRVATGDGVVVAVIDTGVAAAGSPYFSADRISTFDYLGGMSEEDKEARGMDCTHGTRVASLIAAARPEGRGVDVRTNFAGIAPDAQIISYRTLSASEANGEEGESLEPTIAAVRDATRRKVQVINLSQSVSVSDPLIGPYGAAVRDALDAGIVVVAAAGNLVPDAPLEASYPAAFDGVIAVGASTRSDAATPVSRPGPYVAVGAPGSDIMALLPSRNVAAPGVQNQAYESGLVGTSYAAPVVSGVVALMLEKDPDLTPEEVAFRLRATADPPPATVPDSRLGHGIVNPMRALTGQTAPQQANPSADAAVPVEPLPLPEEPDMGPAVIAVSVGMGALLLASVGLVAAQTIPAAVRREKSARRPLG